MKILPLFSCVAWSVAMLVAAPHASAQALNVAMPLGSACVAGYHWEMAGGFAQCIANPPPTPPTPPSPPPSSSCGASYPGYYDSPGTFVYIGYWNIQNGDSGGQGPGIFVWFNGTKIFENPYVSIAPDWESAVDANMPAGYSRGQYINADPGNSNGTAWYAFGVCKN
ncbi:hypothetical protein LMG19282_01474 [Cupriavidus campinensis]|uniref:Secreted protein n=1 Tax=Cupriavidus campinensis TaxID=151783 RepID=A0ABY3EJH0_9BURK|nr:hypothetical protein [Cupriavidus campinensis]TSP10999.1 hypothetical protein FGG12_19235 [Cupriavidus campinensis]CAG2138289.1 hypothetical protein LMG19282_01474 [Cupriavidus campinensis]